MDYLVLRSELLSDPLGRGYSGMTDAQAATDLNTAYRNRNRGTMTGSEVLNAIDKAEYNALATRQQDVVWNILALGVLNPFGVEAALFADIFGGGSTTIGALQAARVEAISRAWELGLPPMRPGHIGKARA